VELYLILYAIVRFILENYRYDPERGQFFGFSTSQWISMIMLLVAIVSITMRIIMKKKKPVTVAVSSQTENGEPEEKMKAGNTEEE
jgi:prolipoprotein diacylglyceryltransferase